MVFFWANPSKMDENWGYLPITQETSVLTSHLGFLGVSAGLIFRLYGFHEARGKLEI
jgi:hypothetical protein